MKNARALGRTVGELASSTIGLVLFLSFTIVGLRSCSGAAWISEKAPEQYTLEGQDGRVISALVLPHNKVALLYADPATGEREAALARWRGTFGDHYGFGVWYMESAPVPGPNWRIFRRGFEPVFMQMDWLQKFREGRGNPVFPAEGESTRDFVLLAENRSSLVFEKMTLQKVAPSPIFAAYLGAVFTDKEAVETLQQIASGGEMKGAAE